MKYQPTTNASAGKMMSLTCRPHTSPHTVLRQLTGEVS